MALIGWVDPTTDLNDWADGLALDEDDLARYLGAAHTQCVDFLPYTTDPTTDVQTPVIPDPVPDTFVLAQVFQARALYRSALAGGENAIGADGLSVTVFPMDWTVKNLLRPRRVGRVL